MKKGLQHTDKNKHKSSNFDALPKDFYLRNFCSNTDYFNFANRSRNCGPNLILNLNKNQLNGKLNTNSIIQPEIFRSINLHKRSLVHLSQVYCVCFDRTGRYVLTVSSSHLNPIPRKKFRLIVYVVPGPKKFHE